MRAKALVAMLVVSAMGVGCSDGSSWSGSWTIDEVSTPLTGTSRNPLEDAMVDRSVRLSESEVVLPHYTKSGQEMIVPIERVETGSDTSEVVLHPTADDDYLDGSLILTLKNEGRLIVHGVPEDGPSANFFLTLTR